jgi:hypothetical protein
MKLLSSTLYFFTFLLFFTTHLSAQTWLDVKENGGNFNTIQTAFQRQYGSDIYQLQRKLLEKVNKKAPKSPEFEREMKGMVHFNRWATFVEPRVAESQGDMTAMSEGMFRAMSKKGREISTRSANWSLMGPTGIPKNGGNGRVNTVKVHPNDPNTLFACVPTGGLWKSTNGGNTWTAISHSIAAVGATDIEFHPTDPNIMFMVTGDGEGADVFTLGVYKSIDGGMTWNPTSLVFNLSDNKTLSKIVIDPLNPNTMLAGGRAGIYRSLDGGDNWAQVLTGSYRDLELKPGDASVVYAGGYGAIGGFYRSTNGGATWTKNTTNFPTTGVQRVAIAVSELDPNYVYCLAAKSSTFHYEGLYRSTDAGATFTKMSSSPNILGYYDGTAGTSDLTNGQGWYDLALTVGEDINTIFTGGINVWKSIDGGANFSKISFWDAATNASNYVHADIHDLRLEDNTLYAAADGGIYASVDMGVSWTNISSNLAIAQIYNIGLSATNPNLIVSGHQDNGTNLTTNGTTWSHVNGGDGMYCFIDHSNNSKIYASIYNGNHYRSTDGGASFSFVYTIPGGAWVTPWLQDPIIASNQYAAGSNVYKSTNEGTNFTAISNFTAASGQKVEFSYLDVSKLNNQIIFGSYNTRTTANAWVNSKVVKTIDGGATWVDLTAGLPTNAPILTVHIDNNDANILYVGLASYTGNSVFRSMDGGATWANISAGMPQIPVNCFMSQEGTAGTVYLGTDLGVYLSENNGTTWQSFSNGMPNIPIKDLEIYYPTGRLRAATYGLGIWQSSLNNYNQAPSVSITSPITNSVIAAPANVVINANAVDSDGSIAYVEFYNGTDLLGTDNTAPYSFTWENVAVGPYILTAKAYDNSGASATSTPANITISMANDAGIIAITNPNGVINLTSFTPSVTLKNFGSGALTSAQIIYKVDNGTETTYNWTGNLIGNSSVVVSLGSVTGYAAGVHTFTAKTAMPNGQADGNILNDATVNNFEYVTCSNINEPADNTPTSATVIAPNSFINSQIGSRFDNDFYKITTNNASPKLKVTLTNLPENYNLFVYVAKQNGQISHLVSASLKQDRRNEKITLNFPKKGATYFIRVASQNGKFSANECYTLTVNTSSTNFFNNNRNEAGEEEETGATTTEEVLSLYPNPTREDINIRFQAAEEADYTVQILDIMGKEVHRELANFRAGNNILTIPTDNIMKGIYFVKVSSETQSEVSKLVVEK